MKKVFGVILSFVIVISSCVKDDIAPVSKFSYEPLEGNRYSIFYFDASQSYDPDNATYSLKYRWDFDGDGEFDTDLSEDSKTSFKFLEVNCFDVILEVVDPEGNISRSSKELCVSNKNSTPFALFAILPPLASLGTEVTFDASRSFDWEESPNKLEVRWDIDGDKIWDTDYSVNKTTKHLFSQPGEYVISMEVRDSEGATAVKEKVLEVANTYNEYNYLVDHRDAKVYGIVKIGEQWVMAQNLVYGTFVENEVTPRNNGLCEIFGYNNHEENVSDYGGLYLWDEVLNYTDREGDQGFCPTGWHLPSDDEWKQLERDMGMEPFMVDSIGWERGQGIGTKLKKNGLSGFEAGLYGYRLPYRIYSDIGQETRFWSSTMNEDGSVWVRGLAVWSEGIMRGTARNNYGYSVRCFKNK